MSLITKLLMAEEPFIATSQDIKILQTDFIKDFVISIRAMQTGATAPSIADILSVMGTIQTKKGGSVESELSALELYVYNLLTSSELPLVQLPAGNSQIGRVSDLVLPYNQAASDKSLALRLAFVPNALVNETSLTIEIEELKAASDIKPKTFQKYVFTPPSIGDYNILLDSNYAGEVVGLLVKSTTIPTPTADVTSCKKLKLRIGHDYLYENYWQGMQSHRDYLDSTLYTPLIKNYALLDFAESPIAANTEIQLQVMSEDLNKVEVIVIQEK